MRSPPGPVRGVFFSIFPSWYVSFYLPRVIRSAVPMADASIGNMVPPVSGGEGRKGMIIAIAVIAVVIVAGFAVVFAYVAGTNSNDRNNNDYNNGGNEDVPAPNLEYVSGTWSQNSLSGDTTVNVKVTNTGDAIGSKYIRVDINLGSATYRGSKYVTVAPGETLTETIVIDTPFGKEVTANNIKIRLSST